MGQIASLFAEFTGIQYNKENRYFYDYHRINFLTAHDGFTGYDLVSYNDKHNEKNGENNLDGNNTNWSWNSGIEGQTNNRKTLDFRLARLKAMMATLLLSNGTPMILAGDEFLNTQYGNNNAYSQDNLISWLDWKMENSYARQMQHFIEDIIQMRKDFPLFTSDTVAVMQNAEGRPLDIHNLPHGMRDFGIICYTQGNIYFVIFNANPHIVYYELQKKSKYICLLNTSTQSVISRNKIAVEAWSLIVLKKQS